MGSHSSFFIMEETVPIKCYKALGCAIIAQAIKDYLYTDYSEQSLHDFLYNTQWVQCLDLDIDYLWANTIKKKKEIEI